MPSLGVAIILYLVVTQSAAKILPPQFSDRSSFPPSLKTSRYLQAEGEVSRMFVKTFKSALVRVIKFYRTIKPEIKLATCFSRYAGIVQGRSYQCVGECNGQEARARGRAMTKDEEENVTVQQLLRDMVHATMLFMTDLMPQPVATMMRMVMEMWRTTRDMYQAVKQDDMGNCSLEYMSKRFWGWIGI